MKKILWMVATLVMCMTMSVTLTSCGDDDEPTPTQQNGGNNGNDNGNGGNDQGGNGGGENGGGNGGNDQDIDRSGVIDGRKYIDLGLPSGTLWAECNVGANTPEDYGDYFAWGETEAKDDYSWSTYKWCMGTENSLTKYCGVSTYGYNGFTDELTELRPEDDAASANWSSAWQMPSIDQFAELVNADYTTLEWKVESRTDGVVHRNEYWLVITSKKNGNSISLPFAGYRYGISFSNNSSTGNGSYWCRMGHYRHPQDVHFFSVSGNPDSHYLNLEGSRYRYYGQSVRPVRK